MNLKSNKAKAALTKQAIKLESYFSHHEFVYLSTVLKYDDLLELANYAGFCAEYPRFIPTQCTWQEFMWAAPFLGFRAMRNAIHNVDALGTYDEIMVVSRTIKDDAIRKELFDEALKRGVMLSTDEIKKIEANALKYSRDYVFSPLAKQANQTAARVNNMTDKFKELKISGTKTSESNPRQSSFSLLDLIGIFSESSDRKHSRGKCNGDCANCPPHYGYRYGRWYYGHSHTEGCEFGGNSCSGGRD